MKGKHHAIAPAPDVRKAIQEELLENRLRILHAVNPETENHRIINR